MNRLKLISLAVILSSSVTVTLADSIPTDSQTQCISDVTVPLAQVPLSALGSAIAIETIANKNVQQFKQIMQNPQPNPWTTIYKQGYELAASWEYNIKVLNHRLPTTPTNQGDYHPLTIMKYCAVGDVINANLSTQIDTIGDLGVLKTGVDFVHHFFPNVSDKELFTSKQYQAKVLAILVYWGSLQEYAVENVQDDNMWLYTLKTPQPIINPVFTEKSLGEKVGLTILPQVNWFYWPIYFYKQAQQVFLKQPGIQTNATVPAKINPVWLKIYDTLYKNDSFQQLLKITQHIDINNPEDPALYPEIGTWLINFSKAPLVNNAITSLNSTMQDKSETETSTQDHPLLRKVLVAKFKSLTASLSASLTPIALAQTGATINKLENDASTNTIINSLQAPTNCEDKLHMSYISNGLKNMHDEVFKQVPQQADDYSKDFGETFDQITKQ